ncbi:hypothetical protein ONZ45_g3795 [Pleurotus djamor]|nr:hypothetical protein ONZ45_g3795 [Pleurotus djamor]
MNVSQQEPVATERTALLRGDDSETCSGTSSVSDICDQPLVKAHEAIYDRFSPARKRVIVALLAWSGLIPCTFIPSIPQIAFDLRTTGEVISYAVSISIFAIGVGSLFWATHSGYYGRRPIYLIGLPLLVIGSTAVGLSTSIPELMAWRFLQAFACSGGVSVGAAVIGDIYKLEERGGYMGIFFAAMLLGPALAPLAGGVAAHYASWRVMQYILAIAAAVDFVLVYFWFPETSHPGTRGIDKYNSGESKHGRKYKLLNPFESLWLLRSPNLLAITMSGFTVLFTDYALLTPLAYTIGARYGITNEAIIGLCFVPCGVGNCIGAPLGGRISDYVVAKRRKARGGVWVPEDRLWITLFAAGILTPLSVLACGIITEYVPGTLGLVLNLVSLFFNGLGVDMVLSPSASYIVDIMHTKSAESMAVNNGFRSLIMAAAIAGIFPMINLIGVARTYAIVAIIAWGGFGPFSIAATTLNYSTIMTPSTQSSTSQPTHQRFTPGHRKSQPGLLCNIEPTTSIPCRDLAPSELGPLYDYRNPLPPSWSTTGGFEIPAVVAYPSPPPTTSNLKRSVPLPNVTFHGGCRSSLVGFESTSSKLHRIFEPPMSTPHGCNLPLSPPPTIPTNTHALPLDLNTIPLTLPPTPEEDDSDIVEDDLLPQPNPPLVSQDRVESSTSAHLLSPALESSPRASDSAQLLSPLSPEWNPTGIQFLVPHDTDSSLLSSDDGDLQLRRCKEPFNDRSDLSPLDIQRSTGDDDHAMDVDPESSPEDLEECFTPRTPEPSNQPYLDSFDDFYDKSDYDRLFEDDLLSFSHPSSPSISTHSLPDLEFDDDDSHPSPPMSLISLPGADIDDDLIPIDLALPSYHPDTPANPTGLLLIDDGEPIELSMLSDIPDPDSHLAAFVSDALRNSDDPELHGLQAIRQRALASERIARQKEAAAIEEGALIARAEARRVKKQEKEKAREVAALLRLKLGLAERQRQEVVNDSCHTLGGDVEMEDERAGVSGVVKKKKKKSKNMIGSVPALVARMVFRRRTEIMKPLPNRHLEMTQKSTYSPSSLSRSPWLALPASLDGEEDEHANDGMDIFESESILHSVDADPVEEVEPGKLS